MNNFTQIFTLCFQILKLIWHYSNYKRGDFFWIDGDEHDHEFKWFGDRNRGIN